MEREARDAKKQAELANQEVRTHAGRRRPPPPPPTPLVSPTLPTVAHCAAHTCSRAHASTPRQVDNVVFEVVVGMSLDADPAQKPDGVVQQVRPLAPTHRVSFSLVGYAARTSPRNPTTTTSFTRCLPPPRCAYRTLHRAHTPCRSVQLFQGLKHFIDSTLFNGVVYSAILLNCVTLAANNPNPDEQYRCEPRLPPPPSGPHHAAPLALTRGPEPVLSR